MEKVRGARRLQTSQLMQLLSTKKLPGAFSGLRTRWSLRRDEAEATKEAASEGFVELYASVDAGDEEEEEAETTATERRPERWLAAHGLWAPRRCDTEREARIARV